MFFQGDWVVRWLRVHLLILAWWWAQGPKINPRSPLPVPTLSEEST